jgi:hypothetical protein
MAKIATHAQTSAQFPRTRTHTHTPTHAHPESPSAHRLQNPVVVLLGKLAPLVIADEGLQLTLQRTHDQNAVGIHGEGPA